MGAVTIHIVSCFALCYLKLGELFENEILKIQSYAMDTLERFQETVE